MNREPNWEDFGRRLHSLEKIVAEEMVEMAEKMGASLAKSLKINQIRRFLDALRKIEQEFYQVSMFQNPQGLERIRYNLTMLRPKLAYAAARDKNVKPLMTVLEPAIKAAAANPKDNFEKLLRFMEAIIAYHRYYEGN